MKRLWAVIKLPNRRVSMRKTKAGSILVQFKRLCEAKEKVIGAEVLLSPEALDAVVRLWLQKRHDWHPDGMKLGKVLEDE